MQGDTPRSPEQPPASPIQTTPHDARERTFTIFIVAGEHSGDALGGKLMAELNARCPNRIRYLGVGGTDMATQGLISQYPLADVAVMGPVNIVKALPRITRRVYRTVDAALTADPDCVVIIDSPEFTHPIAKRIRKRRPDIPIVDYVSPSVWAWRPGRARKMAPYVDHLLALLPFEPAAHDRLGGPPCTYVGHPLIERLDWLNALETDSLKARLGLDAAKPVLVVLPGSRRSEVRVLMAPFGGTVEKLSEAGITPEVIIPAVEDLKNEIAEAAASWPVKPHIITGQDDKFRAFKIADCALAASGTVTLELAMAGTPMVVGYLVDGLAANLQFLVKVPSIILANLVLDEAVFPEFIQENCNPDELSAALIPLFNNTPARQTQLAALAQIPQKMTRSDGQTPSAVATDIVLHHAVNGRASK
ncbi:MAG: lipid-A-disaccharide synthase [Pseudomonadota bacterium]